MFCYHVLLAGMERISFHLGQFVVTGEPVAVMGGRAQSAVAKAGRCKPTRTLRGSARTGFPSIQAPWWGRRPEGSQMMMRKTSLILLGAAAGVPVPLIAPQPGMVVDGPRAQAAAADTYRQLSLFGDVFERVRADYVEKPDDSKLIESAINGMLAGLDPHSSYMDSKSFRDMQVQTRGELGGLGLEVTL